MMLALPLPVLPALPACSACSADATAAHKCLPLHLQPRRPPMPSARLVLQRVVPDQRPHTGERDEASLLPKPASLSMFSFFSLSFALSLSICLRRASGKRSGRNGTHLGECVCVPAVDPAHAAAELFCRPAALHRPTPLGRRQSSGGLAPHLTSSRRARTAPH